MKLSIFTALLGLTFAAPEEEEVLSIPGYPEYDNFQMFSGYHNIKGTSKNIHYMFMTSQSDPENDPLIIWFNGGPGCSSMLAWAQEHGPFLQSDTNATFHKNPYSWNNEANMLYIEQPAGVGFSWCDNENSVKDCEHSDNTIGKDNMDVILGFYNKYPEFKEHDLYISGESYGGIYVPKTAEAVIHYNEMAKRRGDFQPNIKGFMVGNGVTNWKYDTSAAMVEMGYWHSMYNTATYKQIQASGCEWWKFEFYDPKTLPPHCNDLLNKVGDSFQDVNIYNIFGFCYHPDANTTEGKNIPAAGELGMSVVGGQIKTFKKVWTPQEYTPWAFKKTTHKDMKETPPCVNGQFIINYLNRADVREALHIPTNYPGWDMCTSMKGWTYDVYQIGSQYLWDSLKGKVRMMHFSGDIDGAVPTDGTWNWVQELNRPVLEELRPWSYGDHVAGYIAEYDGLTYATVHGAGHMVPEDKPPESYHLIFNWIK